MPPTCVTCTVTMLQNGCSCHRKVPMSCALAPDTPSTANPTPHAVLAIRAILSPPSGAASAAPHADQRNQESRFFTPVELGDERLCYSRRHVVAGPGGRA